MFWYVVTFAPSAAISEKAVQPLPAQRSILKPSSFPELSVQLRLIWELETALAARFDGDVGGLTTG